MDCSERKVLFSRETLLLWLGLFVIVVAAPFSIMRVGPLPSFFLEAGSLLGCLILVAFTLLSGSLKTRSAPPKSNRPAASPLPKRSWATAPRA